MEMSQAGAGTKLRRLNLLCISFPVLRIGMEGEGWIAEAGIDDTLVH